VVETREPGGTPLGESLRAILLETEPGGMSLASEALLFAASRAELVRRVVRPALAEGRWVVSDRFLDSSLAYQGAARGLGIDAVAAMNAPAVDGSRPDRTIVVDVPVDVAAGRRSAGPDRIEAEGSGFQQAVAAGYRLLAEREPERIALVDGHGTPEAVHARVLEALGLDER
jgi:dTMP kinase